jgi:pimeloyl-ACP methyl ester carboxylesterase
LTPRACNEFRIIAFDTMRTVIACLVSLIALVAAAPTETRAEERTLPLPPAATVLTLSGLNFNLTRYMPRQFGGLFARPPYVMREVRYPASLAADSISKGVAALDTALRTTSGPVIVLAHSQGAQVASHWMREHADDPAAPSGNRLVFLLTGNPLRSEGGYIIGRREVGGTIGEPTPVSTRWKVIDVARRYDGWADWPADETNRLAVEKARAGMFTIHTRYDVVGLHDPSNILWTRGTTTFVLTR